MVMPNQSLGTQTAADVDTGKETEGRLSCRHPRKGLRQQGISSVGTTMSEADNATFPASPGAIDKTANGDIAVPVCDVAQHLVDGRCCQLLAEFPGAAHDSRDDVLPERTLIVA